MFIFFGRVQLPRHNSGVLQVIPFSLGIADYFETPYPDYSGSERKPILKIEVLTPKGNFALLKEVLGWDPAVDVRYQKTWGTSSH
jgi:hypothetical protein